MPLAGQRAESALVHVPIKHAVCTRVYFKNIFINFKRHRVLKTQAVHPWAATQGTPAGRHEVAPQCIRSATQSDAWPLVTTLVWVAPGACSPGNLMLQRLYVTSERMKSWSAGTIQMHILLYQSGNKRPPAMNRFQDVNFPGSIQYFRRENRVDMLSANWETFREHEKLKLLV
eukprot:scaffold21188_cov19-Tisochrysis_lutea.AAC.1